MAQIIIMFAALNGHADDLQLFKKYIMFTHSNSRTALFNVAFIEEMIFAKVIAQIYQTGFIILIIWFY